MSIVQSANTIIKTFTKIILFLSLYKQNSNQLSQSANNLLQNVYSKLRYMKFFEFMTVSARTHRRDSHGQRRVSFADECYSP